ncbi:hypothetical protein F2Q70_00025614 [Brassica cretica]|uniref:Uncharacterized protein n=1 Tax=Brassica cretica TaxID=69181 RepID=A0A8S9LCM6_BRACR|nr:hypothetical protein F2Q70_00025614 [Brassica cretica]
MKERCGHDLKREKEVAYALEKRKLLVVFLIFVGLARVHPISLSPKVFLILDEHSLSSIHSQLASRAAIARIPRSASSRPDNDQLATRQRSARATSTPARSSSRPFEVLLVVRFSTICKQKVTLILRT